MSEHIVTVTDDTFDDLVLKADRPVLVDFWAEWCGPCRLIAPILDDIADEQAGKLLIARLPRSPLRLAPNPERLSRLECDSAGSIAANN